MAVAVRPLARDIWSITVPLSPGVLSVYLVRGSNSLALVDTGYLYTIPAVDAAMRSLGMSFADLDLIVLTHGHPDHVGACAEVGGDRARPLVHRADLDLLGGAEAHLRSGVEQAHTMRTLGRPDEAAEREAFVRRSVGAAVTGARALDDGDVVDLGAGRRLNVVHTPGHTGGSVTLLAEAEGIAFTGDAVQARGGRPGVLPLYFDPAAYLGSLRRISRLGAQTLALGHPYRWAGGTDGPEPDVVRTGDAARATLAESIQYVDAARRAVASALETGPASAAELVDRAMERLPAPFRPDSPHWDPASAAALLAHAGELGWR